MSLFYWLMSRPVGGEPATVNPDVVSVTLMSMSLSRLFKQSLSGTVALLLGW